MVEGGTCTLQSFIDAGMWDEVFVEKSTLLIGNGVKAPVVSGYREWSCQEHFGHSFFHYTRSEL